MLSERRKAQISDEELYRREVQSHLDQERGPKTWREIMFTADNAKWIATTVIVPLAIFAWGLGQRQLVEGRQDVAQLTALLPALANTDQHQHCLALTVLEELVTVEPDSKTMGGTARRIEQEVYAQQHSGDPKVSADAAKSADCLGQGAAPAQTASLNEQSAGTTVSTSSPAPPLSTFTASTTVYLQIYDEEQRAEAMTLQSALEDAGIPVRGIDDIGIDHGPGPIPFPQTSNVDIRFYKDSDQSTALALAPLVQKVLPGYGKPTVRDLTSRGAQTRPGTIEIWFPCRASPCVGTTS